MYPLASLFRRTKHLRGSFWLTALLVLGLTLACAGGANATSWLPGAVITNTQSNWADITTTAGALLQADFNSVYAPKGGALLVGIAAPFGPPFYMLFTDALSVQTYLPANGMPGPLTNSFIDPLSSPAGSFGGEVVALQLNVDFNNAGLLLGTSGIPFGDLVLENFSTLPALNDLTVSQFLADDNTCLGGGSCIYSIAALDSVTANLNLSFQNGVPTSFAQTNLVAPSVAPVPEPSSLALVGSGLLGLLGWTRRLRRR